VTLDQVADADVQAAIAADHRAHDPLPGFSGERRTPLRP